MSKYRLYDMELGVFLQRDFLPSENKYRTFNNTPVMQQDPDGLEIITDCPIDEYLKELGISVYDIHKGDDGKWHYRSWATGGNGLEGEIVRDMINSLRKFSIAGGETKDDKAKQVELDNLKKHINARIKIIEAAKAGTGIPKSSGCFVATCLAVTVGNVKAGAGDPPAPPKPEIKPQEPGFEDYWEGYLRNLLYHYSKEETTQPYDWVPGDYGFIENQNKSPNGKGGQDKTHWGENIIYIGGEKYWGWWPSSGQQYKSLQEWIEIMRGKDDTKWLTKDQEDKKQEGKPGKLDDKRLFPKLGLD